MYSGWTAVAVNVATRDLPLPPMPVRVTRRTSGLLRSAETSPTSSSRPYVVEARTGIRARLRGCAAGARDVAEGGVGAQDPRFQLLERLAGLDAELVGQRRPCLGVDRDRLLAPTAAVERAHQQPPEPLAGGIAVDERPRLVDQLARTTLAQAQVEPVLDHPQAQLGQPPGLGLQVRRVPHVLQCLAAPERQRLAQRGVGRLEVTGRGLGLGQAREVGEPGDVRRQCGDLAQLRPQASEGAERVRRRARPDPRDELVGTRLRAGREGEHGEQGAGALARR